MGGSLDDLPDAPVKSAGGFLRWLLIACVLSVLVLIWAAAFRLVAGAMSHFAGAGGGAPSASLSDLATLLFGSASLALILYSFLTSILAIFGWQGIQEKIRDSVQKETSEKLRLLEQESRGRVLSGLGFMIGELSSSPDSLAPLDRGRMRMAVDLCRAGYASLKGTHERAELNGLNNLVYYSAQLGQPADGLLLLEDARVLRRKGQELNAPNLLLTYCRVVLGYSSDPKERAEALTIVSDLAGRNLSEREEKEAKLYLASFSKADA